MNRHTTPRSGPPGVEIRRIAAAETRPLRQEILRPHQRIEDLVYEGDDDPRSCHFGAYLDGRLVGVASAYRQDPPGAPADAGAWRLRGMAARPEARRRGVGTLLLHACEQHARAHGGTRMWFNARVTALEFYFANGYEAFGEPYELPDAGPHRFAARNL